MNARPPASRRVSDRQISLVAVGICCAATVAGTAFGAGALAAAVGFVTGLGVFAVPFALAASIIVVLRPSMRREARTRR